MVVRDPFLQAAIDEAQQGLAEGGIPIGSVIVHQGAILPIRHPDRRRCERQGPVQPAGRGEDTHRRTFQTMLAEIEAVHAPPESFPGEYEAYLHSYVDKNVVFKKAALDRELAAVKDTGSALEFAIRRELDSIAFYNEVKPIIPERQQSIVDTIIAEERSHYTTLCDLKKQLKK